jgi:hypothetical protein
VSVCGPLLQLGHDQPVIGRLGLSNDESGFLTFADASLGAAGMQPAPQGRFPAFGEDLIGRVVIRALITWCNRMLTS